MMSRIKAWITGRKGHVDPKKEAALSQARTELAMKMVAFDTTRSNLRRVAEEVDRRLNGHGQ